MSSSSPFHPGEQAVQERLGVREYTELFARQVVRPFMPEQQRKFYQQLPFLVAAARDTDGRPWATLLAGEPGFIGSPDAQSLTIGTQVLAGDALADSLVPGADLGLLGIEFATRRRNRVNGRIASRDDTGLRLAVDQSFGNCPQYIHPREWSTASLGNPPVVHRHSRLSTPLRQWIEQADTFFIATGHRDGDGRQFGMDASHRGGEPGFVQILDDQRLLWPDYAGNNHFNTLGNLLLDARVGLLFVDFARGHMLQLSGRAVIDWQPSGRWQNTGAQRLVTVHIDAVVELRGALPIRWNDAGHALRSLRVTQKRPESVDVSSFILQARDGGPLPDFQPGQHLPIDVMLPGQQQRTSRSYSLSAPANGQYYRLTVKREAHGLVSQFLHDSLQPGDLLGARQPGGEFTLRSGTRPVVLISAGVGITPMMSMLGALAQAGEKREVWFIHGARDGDHHPLAGELRALAGGNPRIHAQVFYSRPRAEDRRGVDFEHHGRIDAARLAVLLPGLDADFYLCGPTAFLADLHRDLRALGVPDEQLFSEHFGGGSS